MDHTVFHKWIIKQTNYKREVTGVDGTLPTGIHRKPQVNDDKKTVWM